MERGYVHNAPSFNTQADSVLPQCSKPVVFLNQRAESVLLRPPQYTSSQLGIVCRSAAQLLPTHLILAWRERERERGSESGN
jgi:hypothetical protein